MSNFLMITIHYAKRAFRDVTDVLILLGIPLGLIVVWGLINEAAMTPCGYNAVSSNLAPAFILSFQFFSGGTMMLLLYKDLRTDMRWRLGAAPCSLKTFLVPAFFANWIFSLAQGVVLVGITALFLNVYWGNLLVLALVLLLVSLIAILIFALVFIFVPKYSTANALIYAISFGMMTLSGFMFFGLHEFLTNYGTPLALGTRAIVASGMMSDISILYGVIERGIEQSWINIGILAGIALVLATVAGIAAKGKNV